MKELEMAVGPVLSSSYRFPVLLQLKIFWIRIWINWRVYRETVSLVFMEHVYLYLVV